MVFTFSVKHLITVLCVENKVFSPWFHKNTTKMDLSMKINIQHLLKVVLKNTLKLQTNIYQT